MARYARAGNVSQANKPLRNTRRPNDTLQVYLESFEFFHSILGISPSGIH